MQSDGYGFLYKNFRLRLTFMPGVIYSSSLDIYCNYLWFFNEKFCRAVTAISCFVPTILFFLNILYFLEQFPVNSKLELRVQRVSIDTDPHKCTVSPTISILHLSGIGLLQLINLHGPTVITRSLQFTLGSTFGVVHSTHLTNVEWH